LFAAKAQGLIGNETKIQVKEERDPSKETQLAQYKYLTWREQKECGLGVFLQN